MVDYAGAAILSVAPTLTARTARVVAPTWTSNFMAPLGISTNISQAATLGGKLYHLNYVNLRQYDPVVNAWTFKANMPGNPNIFYQAMAALDPYLYVWGGLNGSNGAAVYDLWRYDPASDSWTQLATSPNTLTSSWNGRLVGDSATQKLFAFPNGPTVGVYNVATNTWGTNFAAPNSPSGVVAHNNGKIYVQGGSTNALHELNPSTQTFTAKATPLDRRFYQAMFSWNGLVWTVGGGLASSGFAATASTHSYDPVTNAWAVQDSLERPRSSGCGDVVGGRMAIVGGYDSTTVPYGTWVTNCETYTPDVTEGIAAIDLDLVLTDYQQARGTIEITAPTITGAEVIDPKRLSTGPIKVGARPVGFRDARYWERIPGAMPLPGPSDSNIFGYGQGDPFAQPYTLDECAFGVDGQYLYVGSGYWSPQPYGSGWQWWSNRLYRFDSASETWSELEAFPGYVGSEGCMGAVVDGKFYAVMGDAGISPDGRPFCSTCVAPDPQFDEADTWMLRSLWVYDIAADTWTRGPQPPEVQSYGNCCVFDGKLYVAQGYGPNWDDDNGFWMFDPATQTWTVLADLLHVQDDIPAIFAAENKIWLINYDRVGDRPYPVYIHCYDPATNTWTDDTSTFTTLDDHDLGPLTQLYMEASAPVKITDARWWLVGSDATYEINLDDRTVGDTRFKWNYRTSYNYGPWTNGGAYLYNGDLYSFGPWNSGDQNNPIGMWVIRDALE